jgi:hypothetical protein
VPATKFSAINKYVLMSVNDQASFRSAIRALIASDKPAADRVFAQIKRYHELKKQQETDPAGDFAEMEALRKSDKASYDNWMLLFAGPQSGGGSGSIASDNVQISWLWNIKDEDNSWYPDPLMPLGADDSLAIPNLDNGVPGQKVQSVYVDVWVPHDTAPGTYNGDITIAGSSVTALSVPITLTVLPFELPNKLSFVCDMNGYNYPLPHGLGWDPAIDLHRLAHRNRLNINIVPVSHSGNFTVGQMAMEATGKGKDMRVRSFKKFDTAFGPLLSGKAFSDLPRAGQPVPAFYLPFYENWPGTTAEGFTFDQSGRHLDITQDFTQQYKDGYVAVCKQFGEHLKSKGYDKTDFQVFLNSKYQYAPEITFWLLDEPMFRDDYLAIQMFGDLTREGFKDCAPVNVDYRIDCSRVEESHGMMNTVDTMVFSQTNIREYRKIATDFMRSYETKRSGQPRKAWVYGGAGDLRSSAVSARGWCVDTWLSGQDGLLPWLAYGKSDSWDSLAKAKNAIFYPAFEKWDYKGCYGSLRMKSFRDGQQDAEYLNLLARKLGATRSEVRALIGPNLFEGSVETTFAEDAGTISYRALTPDKLVALRRLMGANL